MHGTAAAAATATANKTGAASKRKSTQGASKKKKGQDAKVLEIKDFATKTLPKMAYKSQKLMPLLVGAGAIVPAEKAKPVKRYDKIHAQESNVEVSYTPPGKTFRRQLKKGFYSVFTALNAMELDENLSESMEELLDDSEQECSKFKANELPASTLLVAAAIFIDAEGVAKWQEDDNGKPQVTSKMSLACLTGEEQANFAKDVLLLGDLFLSTGAKAQLSLYLTAFEMLVVDHRKMYGGKPQGELLDAFNAMLEDRDKLPVSAALQVDKLAKLTSMLNQYFDKPDAPGVEHYEPFEIEVLDAIPTEVGPSLRSRRKLPTKNHKSDIDD